MKEVRTQLLRASVPSQILTQFITQNPDGGYRMWRKATGVFDEKVEGALVLIQGQLHRHFRDYGIDYGYGWLFSNHD